MTGAKDAISPDDTIVEAVAEMVGGYMEDHGVAPALTENVLLAASLAKSIVDKARGSYGNLYGLLEKGMADRNHVPYWRECVSENAMRSSPEVLSAEKDLVGILEKMATPEIVAAMAIFDKEYTVEQMRAMIAAVRASPKAPGAGGAG
ncbi:hypothetical protein ABNQ39_00255 (plasmid) [Azospirillum sp. A26]|uniref:hypothetical protein n=1 Tax=Azospirillum sp. A26 TaxID=3160607 RepID=UPI00366E82AE